MQGVLVLRGGSFDGLLQVLAASKGGGGRAAKKCSPVCVNAHINGSMGSRSPCSFVVSRSQVQAKRHTTS